MYDIVLLDPPWPYSNTGLGKTKHVDQHYDLMSESDIYKLPVKDVLNKKSIVFLWATSPKLDMAINAINHWGLHYRNIAHVWVKTTIGGKPLNGCGVRATYSKPQSELLLMASTVKTGRPLQVAVENIPHQVMAPRGKHSEKPQVFMDMIESAYPEASKLELFARRHTDGWTCTGLELTGHDYTSGILA